MVGLGAPRAAQQIAGIATLCYNGAYEDRNSRGIQDGGHRPGIKTESAPPPQWVVGLFDFGLNLFS